MMRGRPAQLVAVPAIPVRYGRRSAVVTVVIADACVTVVVIAAAVVTVVVDVAGTDVGVGAVEAVGECRTCPPSSLIQSAW
jgi:hypothetical protein